MAQVTVAILRTLAAQWREAAARFDAMSRREATPFVQGLYDGQSQRATLCAEELELFLRPRTLVDDYGDTGVIQ